MNLPCGCIPDNSGFGYCSDCTQKLRQKIWREMSPERKAFDRYIDPIGSAAMDEDLDRYVNYGCSCHINPPCSYCINKESEDE